MYFWFFTVIICEEYHGKWIPTFAWKHIIHNTIGKEYTEKVVTRALKLASSYWNSVSTSDLKMFHGKYWLQCSLDAKKHVNFFLIQKSNTTCPQRETDITIWQERYDSYVRNCQPLNSGENFGRKNPPSLSLIDSEPPPKRQLISSPNECIAVSTSQQCSIADGCDAHVDENVECFHIITCWFGIRNRCSRHPRS